MHPVKIQFRSSDGSSAHFDAVIDRQIHQRAVVIQRDSQKASFLPGRFPAPTQGAILKAVLADDRSQRKAVKARYLGPAATPVEREIGHETLRLSLAKSRKLIRSNIALFATAA